MNQSLLTEQILEFRRTNDSFRKSIMERSVKRSFRFYDGPPFTSGDPHYGHLLQSTVKDMVPRWMTMRGYRVERKRGRDCHGIPAENFVNKQLGITTKKQVEAEYGVGPYVEACRNMVNQVNDNRKWFVDHVGRWVDMDNAYFTMDNDFMESVIWVFSDLYNKNLIYKGFKVLGYSRALGTALSASEIAEGYEDRQDPAVTVRFKIQSSAQQISPNPSLSRGGQEQTEVVCAIIKNEQGAYLMEYDTRIGNWMFPGGKMEVGETKEEAIARELKEELGVEVITQSFHGTIPYVHKNKVFLLHYIDVTIAGEPQNLEPEKHSDIKRVGKIPHENAFGFAIKIENTLIDDEDQIQQDFVDFLNLEKGLIGLPELATAPVYFLAWTTTPWTLPSNMFLAVNSKLTYVQVYDKESQCYYILAKNLLGKYFKNPAEYEIIYQMKGKELIGLRYEPLFSYIGDSLKSKVESLKSGYLDKFFQVLDADFVTDDAGTGIAHEAPAFGELDYNLVAGFLGRDTAHEWLFNPVDDNGEFTAEVPERQGMNVIQASSEIAKFLKHRGDIIKHETINHSYPHCPRTSTPLIYRAMESRFVKEDQLKQQTVPLAEQLNFVPSSVKNRFIEGLKSAPDWNISRSRYWGAPLPVWIPESGQGDPLVLGSREEMYQWSLTGSKNLEKREENGKIVYRDMIRDVELDLHRPYIDNIRFMKDGVKYTRIPEVLDCWFESGSMPYGQEKYKGEKSAISNQKLENSLPEGYEIIDNLPVERWEEYKNLRLEALEKHPEAFGPREKFLAEQSFADDVWQKNLQNNAEKYLFLSYQGTLVGMVRTARKAGEEHIAWINNFYVQESHRRKGFGTKMLQYCEDYQKSQGNSSIQLTVYKSNALALHLYEKDGFKVLGEQTENVYGTIIDMRVLEKDLSQISLSSGFNPTAHFIAEGLDQTRGWFRSLHVLGTATFSKSIFENVVVTGMILAEDGKKMSKSKKNYPDPRGLLEQYGPDAFRLYLLGSPVVRSEPLRFKEKDVEQVLKDVLLPLHNVVNFFSTYAKVDQYKHPGTELYFMRHADAGNQKQETRNKNGEIEELERTKETPLSIVGGEQITSEKFIEEIGRVMPDIILCSDFVRALQTAQGAQKILKEVYGKEVEIITTSKLGMDADENTVASIFAEINKDYQGKKVLLVSHNLRFRHVWKYLTGFVGDVMDPVIKKKYGIANTEIIKLPLISLNNELDQWIYAELYSLIEQLDTELVGYRLDSATMLLTGFIEKLTNWYLRRSRRRFRANGMDEDKLSAYHTLYEVVTIYLKLLAPFAPFTTEYLRKQLQNFCQIENKNQSIHLEYRPLQGSKYINSELMEEITTVRTIIKQALFVRAKNQIKVKIPLRKMEVRVS